MGTTHDFSGSSPSSVAEAKTLVERIQEHIEAKRDETPDEEAAKLRRLQNRILESLDDAAHVIPELLQNADDVGGDCTKAVIRLRDEELVIENDGARMSETEVKALGEFAESTKHDLSQIGHFGIGFKTVFSVTDRPHIDSGYTSLEYTEADPEIPQAAFDGTEAEFEGTRVRLPFSEDISDTRLEELQSQLNAIDRLLPFLNNLQTITVERGGETTRYERIDATEGGNGRVTVREYAHPSDETPTETWHYRLLTKSLDVTSETAIQLAEERNLDPEALASRDVNIDVELAFPVSDQGYPAEHEESRLFCYFPTSGETNLPFDVQADFLLKSSREQIRPGHPINDKFLSIAGALTANAIRSFQSDGVPPDELLTLIPDASVDRPSYLTPLTNEVFNAISECAFVPVESGGTRAPVDLLVLPRELHHVIPLADFCDEYDATEVAHPARGLENKDLDRLAALESTRTLSVAEALEAMTEMELPARLSASAVIDLLLAVEEYLDSAYSHKDHYKETVAALKSLSIYPIRGADQDRQSLTGLDDSVYRPASQGEGTYEPFYDNLTLLDETFMSALRSDEVDDETRASVRNLFEERLEVEQIRHKDIVEEVVAEAFASPETHDDETLDEYIEYLRDYAKQYADASNTKLRTSAGEYKRPDELYLPTDYLSGQYDSSLVLGTLTDREPVSTTYLPPDPEADDIDAWRAFFAGMGVLTHLPVSSNVDRPTRETFQAQDELQAYLDIHDDEGTAVRRDRDTTPYGGHDRQYRWMKRADAQHGLIDYALPEAVEEQFETAAGSVEGIGRELLKMLHAYWKATDTTGETTDHDWDRPYQDSMFRTYCWSVPSNGYAINTEKSGCPTSFLTLLRETAWVPGRDDETTEGGYRPSHLYRPNSVTRRATVPLLPEAFADVPAALLDVLNVPDDVGLEQHANGIEQVIAERGDREPSEIEREVRSHLHSLTDRIREATEDDKAELADQFEGCPFIYVEHAEPAFRCPNEVVWSKGLGDHRVAINDDYRMFEELFVDILDVETEPGLDHYIEYLGQADADDWPMVEDAWAEVIKRVAYRDAQGFSLNRAAAELAENGAIPNVAEALAPAAEINYITRNIGMAERLPPVLAKQIALPWYDRRVSDHSEAVNRLRELLDAAVLEKEIDRNIRSPSQQSSDGKLGDRYHLLLNVGYSLLADRDEYQAQELLEDVAGYTVQACENIQCEYQLGSDSTTVTEAVYIDTDEGHVYVADEGAAQLELVEAVATALTLTGPTRNKFVELVQGAIGKDEALVAVYLDSRGLPYEQIDHPGMALNAASTAGEPRSDSNGQTEVEEDSSASQADHGKTDSDRTGSIERGKKHQESPTGEATQADGTSAAPTSTAERTAANRSMSEPEPATADHSGVADQQPAKSIEDRRTESTITVGKSSKRDPSGETKGISRGGPLFGGTAEAQQTGDAGEALVLKHLRNLMRAELTDTTVTELNDTTPSGFVIEGDVDGRQVEIRLEKVPDPQKPRSDLLINGVVLEQERHGFRIVEFAPDERTLVEVKSSKGESRTFRITGAEHEEALSNSRYLIARPVNVGSEDERIETVFDTVPQIELRTESRGRLQVEQLEIDHKGMIVSY